MFENIVSIIEQLDDLENEIDMLPKQLSEEELKLNDLYHTLEFYQLNVSECWYLAKEMRQILKNRRQIKNKMIISKTFNDNINKLINKNSRRILLTEIGKKNMMLQYLILLIR